jgi:hypothetical protein
LGLLCRRLGVYDDSLLLLGARLVAAGREPYRDFYTHYGPLGYTLLAGPLETLVNPGLTLRLSQGAALAGVTALLLAALRRTEVRPSAIAAAGAVLAFSAALAQSSFIGLAFACAAVAVYASGRGFGGTRGVFAPVAAGALLAAAAWTRPAFAAYAAAAVVWLELAAGAPGARRRLGLLLGSAAGWALALYAFFFRSMSPAAMFEATVLAPARLMTLGNRTLLPDFSTAGAAIAMLVGAAVAAAPLAWAWTVPSRGGRLAILGAVVLGALLPLGLGAGAARLTLVLTAVSLAVNAWLAWLHRLALRESPRLWAAGALGASASAFGHYFWSRPDPQHLFPLLALGAASALFAWQGLRPGERLAVAGLFVLAFVPIGPGREPGPPVFSLWNGGLARVREGLSRPGATLLNVWPAGEVPSPAARAVSLADRLSPPSSRFVAYGTNQSLSAGDPVYLFLLSRRLPYTRWFQYDPGLQSSPPVQEEMIRELAQSGSPAAVVWRSEAFAFDPATAQASARTGFDDAADRAYGRAVARFGNYEVRVPGTAGGDDAAPR